MPLCPAQLHISHANRILSTANQSTSKAVIRQQTDGTSNTSKYIHYGDSLKLNGLQRKNDDRYDFAEKVHFVQVLSTIFGLIVTHCLTL